MGWRYEWIAVLPADVYAELVAMLQEDAAKTQATDTATVDDRLDPLIG